MLSGDLDLHSARRKLELRLARGALRRTDGDTTRAAALLGVSLPTIRTLKAAVEQQEGEESMA